MKFSSSLSHYLIENVVESIYYRGLDYADQGRVSQLQEHEKKLTARVGGSQTYDVEFRQGPIHVKGYCTCPYRQSNPDYCKHIIAVAIVWDRQQGKALPTEEMIKNQTIEVDYGFGVKVDAMYNNPLEADLQFLAQASEYSAWGVRPHAKLVIASTLADTLEPLTLKEVNHAFRAIDRLTRRSNFDPYFCAGELSAILSMTYDVIARRLKLTEYQLARQIVIESIVFFYDNYLQSIDGSDGVWMIPKARLPKMVHLLARLGLDADGLSDLGDKLTARIDGWSDILSDLEIKS